MDALALELPILWGLAQLFEQTLILQSLCVDNNMLGWRGVSPASNCFGSSVCQRQSAYHQKLVFRCGEMAVFKHAYDVSLTWVLLSSVNITFIFSKKWMLGATLTGVCCRDTFAFWALFSLMCQRQSHMIKKECFAVAKWQFSNMVMLCHWLLQGFVAATHLHVEPFFHLSSIHETSSKHFTWLTLSVMWAMNWANAIIVASRPKFLWM